MDKTTGYTGTADGGATSHLNFPVIGLGASAGGLVALRRFFEHMPSDSGMAFVVVLHLSPKHESAADQILARDTRMPVVQVHGRVAIEPNHVYVISPSNDLWMDDGHLRVTPSTRPRGHAVAIDLFFRTLADVHRDRAVAIVLSGTGSDGSVGIMRIKEQGGVTLAQSPADSEYDDMPRSAIATGRVDMVLPVVEMPARLIELWDNARTILLPPAPEAHGHIVPTPPDTRRETEDALREILDLLAARCGHDFRHYKRATVLRRIERRLQVNVLPDLPAYRDYLRARPEETTHLLDDMLISVTNFFRDREAFEALERDVIPALFAEHGPGEQVRVWVPACATGEEAYSVAMLMADQAALLPTPPGFQVFASDIDERGLAAGRNGVYPASIITDVPPARLRQFFSKEPQRYRISKPIRDRVLFAQHNVLRDPPFSKLDLVCCRNLMIYLEREIQSRLLEVFHFALRPGGLLFLGSSESADAASDYFEVVDKKHRIYRARVLSRTAQPQVLLPNPPADRRHVQPAPTAGRDRRGFSFADVHQRVLEHYAPPSVIVDHESNIVHMSDRAGRFLHFAGGEPTHNLLNVVRTELRTELRTALFQAVHSNKSVEARRVQLDRGGKPCFVNMIARPFRDPEAGGDFVLVLFDEVEDTLGSDARDAQAGERDVVVLHLEEELRRTRDRLQATIEQSETSNEELKASNEELQAINEELRSATEELETSKEELQSVNEELVTVNFELKNKVDETAKANDDLTNFISSADIATVFVDAGLRIRRFTPRVQDLFNIIPTDIGRCLLDITHRLDYPELAVDATGAFEALRPVEREVRTFDGRHYAVRVVPYRTQENRIDGAVLTFVDISRLRAAQQQAGAAEHEARLAALSAGTHAIIVFDENRTVTAWNSGARSIFGFEAAEIVGQSIDRLAYTGSGIDWLEGEIDVARKRGESMSEHWCVHKDGHRVFCSGLLTAVQGGQTDAFVLITSDASQRVAESERAQHELSSAIAQRVRAEAENTLKDDFLAVMSHELKNPLNLISVNAELLARDPAVRVSESAADAVTGIRRAVHGQSKIIDDLLDMSRMRTGKLKLNLTLVDLGALVANIVETARADSSTAQLDLEWSPPEAPALVNADVSRLEQIVWNLLGNAIKFTPDGGTVEVAIEIDATQCRLVVRDSGPGIEPAFLPRIFELFNQAPGRALSGTAGLGIGLAVARQIVVLHGGRIEAASDGIGHGATFTVSLPRVAPVRKELAALVEIDAADVWEGLRLLLVDDTREGIDGLARLLALEGAEVLRAYSGMEALTLLATQKVDVVLSDLGMPEMDGYALARRIKEDPNLAHLPLIAVTGFARDEDVRRCTEAGFAAHIGKPILLETLSKVVERVCTKASA